MWLWPWRLVVAGILLGLVGYELFMRMTIGKQESG